MHGPDVLGGVTDTPRLRDLSGLPIQPRLKVSEPGSPLEREADQMAESVVGQSERPAIRSAEPQVQRCSCGGSCAECASKADEDEGVQRKEAGSASKGGFTAPSQVHEAIKGPGRPLDPATRSFMEPRFGYDFSRVRIHTDAKAAASADAISATAYAVGNDVVFGTGAYQPSSAAGAKLLAHELTHVVQQGSGRAAPNVSRLVSGLTRCPANTNGTGADPQADLEAADARAAELATNAAVLCEADPLDQDTIDKFTARYGSPPAVGAGFMNRLTGGVVATAEAALTAEIRIMARRFRIVARFFSQNVIYRCIGGSTVFAGCSVASCDGVLAAACHGIGVIFICPSTWPHNNDERGAILVHEAFHANFNDINDAVVRGSGRNFVVADCNSGFAADLNGITNPDDLCPAPP